MTDFDAFSQKQLRLLARAATVNYVLTRNQALLDEVRAFIKDTANLLEENKEKRILKTKEAAKLALWRGFWMDKLDKLGIA